MGTDAEPIEPEAAVVTEMRLPTARPGILWPVGCGAVVVYFVGLAVTNLRGWRTTPIIALICSAIWLLLVAAMLVSAWHDAGGLRRLVLNVVGNFARRQFVTIEREGQGPPVVCFGYRLLVWRVHYIKVQMDGVESVSWSTGQASALSGRDMNDWHVAVWFDTASVATWLRPYERRQTQYLHLVGPSGPLRRIERLGHTLVAFLRSAGVPLEEAEGGREFVRRSGDGADGRSHSQAGPGGSQRLRPAEEDSEDEDDDD